MPLLDLPVGDKPDWELVDDGVKNLRTPAESGVILYALRQSRERLIFNTFPKFSSGYDKTSTNPSHTLQRRARCDVEIGPHTFGDTTFYEVHYQDHAPSSPFIGRTTWIPYVPFTPRADAPRQTPAYTSEARAANPPPEVRSTTPKRANANDVHVSCISAAGHASPEQLKVLGDVLKNINSDGGPPAAKDRSVRPPLAVEHRPPPTHVPEITPSLIRQVAAAAVGDEHLTRIILAASENKATSEQLKDLSKAIQNLKRGPAPNPTPESHRVVPAKESPRPEQEAVQSPSQQPPLSPHAYPSSQSQYRPYAPLREFDIVIEFREAVGERWIIPRGQMTCNMQSQSSVLNQPPFNDLDLTIITTPQGTDAPQLIQLRLSQTPSALWDTIQRWMGDEVKQEKDRAIIERMRHQAACHLAHRLPPGPLLSRIQNSVKAENAPYPVKSIKQEQNNARAKRARPAEVPPRRQDAGSVRHPKSDPFRNYGTTDVALSTVKTLPVTVPKITTPQSTCRPQERRRTPAAAALADIKRGRPPSKGGTPLSIVAAANLAAGNSDADGITLIQPYEERIRNAQAGRRPGDYSSSMEDVIIPTGSTPRPEEATPSRVVFDLTAEGDGDSPTSTSIPSDCSPNATRSPKRRRRSSPFTPGASQSYPIRCHACHKTDVPLIMSGCYCRQCAEAGRAVNDIPPEPKYIYASQSVPAYDSDNISSAQARHAISDEYGAQVRESSLPGGSQRSPTRERSRSIVDRLSASSSMPAPLHDEARVWSMSRPSPASTSYGQEAEMRGEHFGSSLSQPNYAPSDLLGTVPPAPRNSQDTAQGPPSPETALTTTPGPSPFRSMFNPYPNKDSKNGEAR